MWGRFRHSEPARLDLPAPDRLLGPVKKLSHGVLMFPEDRARSDLAATMVKRGSEILQATYSWDAIASRTLSVYQEALSAS